MDKLQFLVLITGNTVITANITLTACSHATIDASSHMMNDKTGLGFQLDGVMHPCVKSHCSKEMYSMNIPKFVHCLSVFCPKALAARGQTTR